MSLVERKKDLNLVVKSYTVDLVGQAIVHLTSEPSTTKLVAFTVLHICLLSRIVWGKYHRAQSMFTESCPVSRGRKMKFKTRMILSFFLYS